MNIQLDLGRRGDGSFVSGRPQRLSIHDLFSGLTVARLKPLTVIKTPLGQNQHRSC